MPASWRRSSARRPRLSRSTSPTAAQVDELVGATADADRVVIAAGQFAPAPALEVTREEFGRIHSVNTEGVFFVAQAYARAMAERGHGAIVGVASIAARMPRMRQAAYCASKAGMRQALRVLGMEVAPLGVRINTVSPGATDTPMMRALAADHSSVDDLAQGSVEAMRPRIPHGRVARPEDVAAVVSFLLAPGASTSSSGHRRRRRRAAGDVTGRPPKKRAVRGTKPPGAYSPGVIAEGRFVYVSGPGPAPQRRADHGHDRGGDAAGAREPRQRPRRGRARATPTSSAVASFSPTSMTSRR